jgi:hypothetical protein
VHSAIGKRPPSDAGGGRNNPCPRQTPNDGGRGTTQYDGTAHGTVERPDTESERLEPLRALVHLSRTLSNHPWCVVPTAAAFAGAPSLSCEGEGLVRGTRW